MQVNSHLVHPPSFWQIEVVSPKYRRRLIRAAAVLIGTTVFLRAPLEVRVERDRRGAWFSQSEAPRASAAVAGSSEDVPLEFAATRATAAQAARERQTYFYFPPTDARLHATATAAGAPFSELIERRLTTLEDFGDTQAGQDVLFLLGAEHQSVGNFDLASDFYEAYGRRSEFCMAEECDQAVASLENAFMFRRAAGEDRAAIENAELLATRFAGVDPRAATRVTLAAAELLDGDRRQHRLRRLLSRRLPPAEAIRAQIRLGKTLLGSDPVKARRAFRRAERLWRRSGASQMPTSPGLSPSEWVAELGRTRELLAESRFIDAERQYQRASRMNPPTYDGPMTEAYARRWTRSRLRPWMERRGRRIRAAERALDRVDALGLSRWTVAAAARRGALYQDLADALDQLDLPAALAAEDGETPMIAQYREPIWRRLVVPAIEHFSSCMHAARQTLAYGVWSERCADGLARHDPTYERGLEIHPSQPHVAQIHASRDHATESPLAGNRR